MTLGLARAVALQGIRVNTVRPGPFATETRDPFGGAEFLTAVHAKTPMGRVGDPPEVAAAIAWLLWPAASCITAATLPVAGGQ